MLKAFLYVGIGLGVLVAVLVGYASTRPDTFKVARSTTIAASPEAIFPLINDLRKFSTWSPFERKDPNIRSEYSGAQSGVGQRHDWEGNMEVGKGWLVISESSAPSKVGIELHMLKPMAATNAVTFTLVPEGNATKVTWEMEGEVPLLAKVIHLFIDMDRMCGDDFGAGLANLKTMAETPSTAPVPQS
jgi:hypothetical protein